LNERKGTPQRNHEGRQTERNPMQQAANTRISPQRIRRGKAIIFLICLVFVTAAFGLLAIMARREAFFPVDLTITRIIQASDGPVLTAVMTAVSWPGFTPQSVVFVVAAALLLYLLGLHWEAIVSVLAAVLEELLNLLVKIVIHRPRPSTDLVHVFGALLTGYSFPSGHVMFYTCWFGFLWFLAYALLKNSWIRALILAVTGGMVLLVGLSRIYLGEHWASDAAGAYLLGGIELIAVIQLYRWGKNHFCRFQSVAGGRC
jgi:membrane-associated phospholipid phosphatase